MYLFLIWKSILLWSNEKNVSISFGEQVRPEAVTCSHILILRGGGSWDPGFK